jgi:hypothetical protein
MTNVAVLFHEIVAHFILEAPNIEPPLVNTVRFMTKWIAGGYASVYVTVFSLHSLLRPFGEELRDARDIPGSS